MSEPIPEHAAIELTVSVGGRPIGTRGTIVAVFDTPRQAYLIEFDGIAGSDELLTLTHDEARRVARVVWTPGDA